MQIEDFDDLLNYLAKEISVYQKKVIPNSWIYDACLMVYGDQYDVSHPVNLWDIDISFEEAYESLKDFDFEIFNTPLEIELEFDRDELFQIKARIKAAGFNVVIHKYDKDPWPSNPHGHICDQNMKIDLRNGNCYRNREFVRSLRKKELLELREKATMRFKGDLPPLEI